MQAKHEKIYVFRPLSEKHFISETGTHFAK
jgi:hypothetical protein